MALRETRRVVWIVIETAMRKSEKGQRMIREEIHREEMRMREKDRRNMREATISLVRKRKLGGKPKYKIKETEKKNNKSEKETVNMEKRVKVKARRRIVRRDSMTGGLVGAGCPQGGGTIP